MPLFFQFLETIYRLKKNCFLTSKRGKKSKQSFSYGVRLILLHIILPFFLCSLLLPVLIVRTGEMILKLLTEEERLGVCLSCNCCFLQIYWANFNHVEECNRKRRALSKVMLLFVRIQLLPNLKNRIKRCMIHKGFPKLITLASNTKDIDLS